MRVISEEERAVILAEVARVSEETPMSWPRRWVGADGRDYRLRWRRDNTAAVDVNGERVMRIAVAVSVTEVPGDDA